MSLIKVGKPTKGAVRPEEKTTVLVMKAARALNKPGIDKSVVFQGPNAAKIYSYSVYPQDTSKVIRESANGARVVGRLIDGKFRVVKA